MKKGLFFTFALAENENLRTLICYLTLLCLWGSTFWQKFVKKKIKGRCRQIETLTPPSRKVLATPLAESDMNWCGFLTSLGFLANQNDGNINCKITWAYQCSFTCNQATNKTAQRKIIITTQYNKYT